MTWRRACVSAERPADWQGDSVGRPNRLASRHLLALQNGCAHCPAAQRLCALLSNHDQCLPEQRQVRYARPRQEAPALPVRANKSNSSKTGSPLCNSLANEPRCLSDSIRCLLIRQRTRLLSWRHVRSSTRTPSHSCSPSHPFSSSRQTVKCTFSSLSWLKVRLARHQVTIQPQ